MSHLRCDLPADQLVEGDAIGGGDDVAVVVVDLELRGRNFRVVFLVLEAHRALDFGDRIDKRTERIARQRLVIAAGVDVLEFVGLIEALLRVDAAEEKALDLVGRIERIAVLRKLVVCELLEHAANVRRELRAVAIEHVAEHEHFARPEHVSRRPIKGSPVDRRGADRFRAGR